MSSRNYLRLQICRLAKAMTLEKLALDFFVPSALQDRHGCVIEHFNGHQNNDRKHYKQNEHNSGDSQSLEFGRSSGRSSGRPLHYSFYLRKPLSSPSIKNRLAAG